MKIRIGVFTAVLLCVFCGCDKHALDFRNKYCGEYTLIKTYEYWSMGGNAGTNKDTVSGSIYYENAEGLEHDMLMLAVGDIPNYVKLRIDKKGAIYLTCGSKSIGEFSDKKHFVADWHSNSCGDGPLGSKWSVSIIGAR